MKFVSEKYLPSVPLGLAFALAVGLRAWNLGDIPLWVDEAESSINALTILQHGYPTDRYLGLPIFENTLSIPWPESEEYEFRDSSYSKKGVAIYHAWLPLYSIAFALRLAGIEPDTAPEVMRVKHGESERHARTVVPRIPSVLYGALFIAMVTGAAWVFYGRDAAWGALVISGFTHSLIWHARQARYYSSTIALCAACLLLMGLMMKKGRWRDFVLGGVAFSLLFHTHLLTFTITCAAFALTIPVLWRQPRIIAKLAVTGGIMFAACAPWLLLTGFLDQAGGLPPAWALLSFPADFFVFFLRKLSVTVLYACAAIWIAGAVLFRSRLPLRLTEPVGPHAWVFVWLFVWMLIAYMTFIFTMPAASYFYGRMSIALIAPGVLALAMFLSAIARVIDAKKSTLITVVFAFVFLAASNRLPRRINPETAESASCLETLDFLQEKMFDSKTRIYSTPNDHLVLTYYTGLPIQSIAAVRKPYLDRYLGDVVLIEAISGYGWMPDEALVEILNSINRVVTPAEYRKLSQRMAQRLVVEDLQGHVRTTEPALEQVPDWLQKLTDLQREWSANYFKTYQGDYFNPIFRGFNFKSYRDWWPIFTYRFVDPDSRRGDHLNYRDRVRNSRATVLPMSAWVIYESPGTTSAPISIPAGESVHLE